MVDRGEPDGGGSRGLTASPDRGQGGERVPVAHKPRTDRAGRRDHGPLQGVGVSACQWHASCEPTESADETQCPTTLPLTLEGGAAKS